jgi:iron complex outermembrane receptor protein
MEALLVASNIGWDTGLFTLNFITGYYDLEQNYSADFFDNSSIPFGGALGDTFIIANNGNHDQISQEVKITGDFADGVVQYVGGLFYMDEQNETNFTDWAGAKPNLFPLNIRTPLENTTQSYAAYTQFNWAVTDRFGLLAGGRYTDEEKDLSLNGVLGGTPTNDADLLAAGIPLDQSESKFTYKLGADYTFADDIMGYISYTTGFKSGGWNARGSSAVELAPFGPEEVVSYEAGLRSEWLENRLRANLTIFRAEYDDIQIATVEPNPNPNAPSLFITTNAGDSRIQGLELELTAAATEYLRIYGNLGLMDGKYTRLSPGGQLAGIGPDPTRTPDATANVGADYTIPNILNGEIFLGGQVAWVDDYYMGNDNAVETLIEAHTLVNAQAGWRNDNWQAIVECRNCFDEEWFGTNLFNVLYTAEPVRYGIRLKYSYQ